MADRAFLMDPNRAIEVVNKLAGDTVEEGQCCEPETCTVH